MWFELSLVEKGLVAIEDLISAAKLQRARRVPLGRLAVNHGKLTMKQVFEVLGLQASSGKPFGKIARSLGYLTEADLALLLMWQQDNDVSICDILVENGLLDRETLQTERRNFQEMLSAATAPSNIDERRF